MCGREGLARTAFICQVWLTGSAAGETCAEMRSREILLNGVDEEDGHFPRTRQSTLNFHGSAATPNVEVATVNLRALLSDAPNESNE